MSAHPSDTGGVSAWDFEIGQSPRWWLVSSWPSSLSSGYYDGYSAALTWLAGQRRYYPAVWPYEWTGRN